MATQHYLKNPTVAGQVLRYVAGYEGRWVALVVFSSAALHLKPRDRWLKWSARQVKERRHLIAQNARFLVLPSRGQWPNLASRVLRLVGERLARDWQEHFGHPVQIAVPLDTNEEAAHTIKANCRQLTSCSRWPAITGASKRASITAATAPKTRTVARCAKPTPLATSRCFAPRPYSCAKLTARTEAASSPSGILNAGLAAVPGA